MHFEAVAHGLRHAAGIDPALVSAKAVAVPEAVRHRALRAGSHRLSKGSPGVLAVQIGIERLPDAVAPKRRQLDQSSLPAEQEIPLLKLAIEITQGQRMNPPGCRPATTAAFFVTAPPVRLAGDRIGADLKVQQLPWSEPQPSQQSQGIGPS